MTPGSFRYLISFLLLSLIGLALLPRIAFRLEPSRTLPELRVSFNWSSASPELIEQQVTTPLEGLFSSIKELQSIRSSTYPGRGEIFLSFDKEADLNLLRYETSALIRQAIPDFPEAVSYPQISSNQESENGPQSMLNYTLNGDQSPYELQRYAEEVLSPELARIPGISDIQVYGATPFAWELAYDPQQLDNLGFTKQNLAKHINNGFLDEPLDQHIRFGVRKNYNSDNSASGKFPDFAFPTNNDSSAQRILYLNDVLDIQRRERPNKAYHRINGLNAINLVIRAEKNSNQLTLANEVKAKIHELTQQLPSSYSLLNTYDATQFLKAELTKILWRSLASLLILLLFVWIISRSWKYLAIISLALGANLGIAAFCYYLLGLELHLYSLAGITVSLGLIIDNSIVMIDHIRHKGNLRVFLALLAATLTTIGALSVIFFLDEVQRMKLLDFVWVMVLNLGISLAVALWLIPALIERFGFASRSEMLNPLQRKRKQRILSFNQFYHRYLTFGTRYKALFLGVIILAFGLPIFLLPDRIGPSPESYEARYYGVDSSSAFFKAGEAYNYVLGNSTYQRDIKPWVDKILGGTLRLFIQETYPNSRQVEPSRTALYVNAQMPYGSTLDQMNETFTRIENFLSQFEEIDQFQSQIQSSQQARMSIYFKPEHDKTSFPYFLKSRLESRAIDLGGADWSVYGVGRGFSNAVGMGAKNSRIVLTGYNYAQLRKEAETLKTKLLTHPRIKEVFLNGRMRWDYRPNFEYVMDLDKQKLVNHGVKTQELLQYLQGQSIAEQNLLFTTINNRYEGVILKTKDSEQGDLWHKLNQTIPADSNSFVKLSDMASIRKQSVGDIIEREDQQYRLLVEYDFIGPYQLQNKVQRKFIDEANQDLPLGYKAKAQGYGGWGDQKGKTQYLLIFLVIGIIYLICAILLESLLQPLAVIATIPISFIGVFLTFYFFELNFDQGGYAAFLLLSGISVNASLYIINDFNNLGKAKGQRSSFDRYLKAFNGKIVPIALTILSTLLGLVPFLLGGADDPFWFSLAAGTMGGLLFSILGILGYLPLFLLRKIENQ